MYQRRERDSNPRYAFDVYTLSRRALSTTQTPLRFSLLVRLYLSNSLIFDNQSLIFSNQFSTPSPQK